MKIFKILFVMCIFLAPSYVFSQEGAQTDSTAAVAPAQEAPAVVAPAEEAPAAEVAPAAEAIAETAEEAPAAEEENPLSYGVDFANGYIWRGQVYNTGITFQPYVSYAFDDKITFNVWGTRNMGDAEADEVYQEFDFGVSFAANDWLTLGATSYYFPGASEAAGPWPLWTDFTSERNTQTLDLTANADLSGFGLPVSVLFSTFVLGADKDENDAQAFSTYVELSSSYDLPVGLNIAPSVGLCFANKSGYYVANSTEGMDLAHFGAKVTKEFTIGEIALPVWGFFSYNPGVVDEEIQSKFNFVVGAQYNF